MERNPKHLDAPDLHGFDQRSGVEAQRLILADYKYCSRDLCCLYTTGTEARTYEEGSGDARKIVTDRVDRLADVLRLTFWSALGAPQIYTNPTGGYGQLK